MSSTPNPLTELIAAGSLDFAERASGAGAVGTSRQPPVRAEGTRFFDHAQRKEAR
jgi:hypothetical protein